MRDFFVVMMIPQLLQLIYIPTREM